MEGEVTGVIGAGAFVAFGDGHEGMLPVRRLRGDWWELNELETMLVGAKSGRAIRLGDPVQVRVERVDAPRGRVDLAPACRVEEAIPKENTTFKSYETRSASWQTSRPTARRGTATTSSTRGRPASC